MQKTPHWIDKLCFIAYSILGLMMGCLVVAYITDNGWQQTLAIPVLCVLSLWLRRKPMLVLVLWFGLH
jgi:hypothetical protein